MRICGLADGRYIHTHRWLKFFSERGHDMCLLSFAPVTPEQRASIDRAGARYLGELEPFHVKRGWRTLAQITRLRQLFRRDKIDLVHSHFLSSNAWYAAITRFHPAVITVTGGDILGEDWQPPSDVRERWLTPFALRDADLITCWSNKLAEVVKRYSRPGVAVEVVHGGVDTDRFHPGPKSAELREALGIPSDAKVVLSPRLMRPLYNLDKVALAAERIWRSVPNTYFLFAVLPVATDAGHERRVREILGTDRGNRVRYLGEIPHDRMVDYYRLADVTVSVPSSDGTPMSVLESMACGTPVVVSEIPHYDPEYIQCEQTVLTAHHEDPDAIASAVVRSLQDVELARALAAEGRRRVVATGSYDAQMRKMERLYQGLMS